VPLKRNPYVSIVLPLAYTDDLVMQCVFALGGANLTFKDSPKPDIEATTAAHYFCIVRSLRVVFQDLVIEDSSKLLRILLVLIMVANFEVCQTHSATPQRLSAYSRGVVELKQAYLF
jgi:hypothetical protein